MLIEVHAASANAGDWHLLRGQPFAMRMMGFGLLRPKTKILGADVAGQVVAVGSQVKQFRRGDEVQGHWATLLCVPAETESRGPRLHQGSAAVGQAQAGLAQLANRVSGMNRRAHAG